LLFTKQNTHKSHASSLTQSVGWKKAKRKKKEQKNCA